MVKQCIGKIKIISHFLFLLAVQISMISCHRGNKQDLDHQKYIIDSLNALYLTNDSIVLHSIDRVKDLISTSDSIGYSKGVVESYLTLYRIYSREEQYPEALEMLRNALKGMDNITNPYLAGRVYFYWGQFQENISNDDLALTYYLKAADNFFQIHDIGRLAKVYRQIGIVTYDNEDWPLCYKYR